MSDHDHDHGRHAPVRMLRIPDVIYLTGVSRTRIYELMARGEFPARRKLSERATAWRSDEIDEWIESRPVADDHAAYGQKR